jgi:hypothetical protein
MDSLTAFDFESAEKQVIFDASSRSHIKDELNALLRRVDYMLSRFMDEHPDFEKNPTKYSFYKDKSEIYNKISRLLRIIDAYDT